MKTDVEELSPTRVRLSVEVPFDELKPSLDKAYREVGRQVRIKGFRPGRVPPPVDTCQWPLFTSGKGRT